MAKPARLWAFSTLVALSALALGCNGTTEDDTAGPEGGSAGTAGSSSPAAGTSSTGGAMGAAGSGTTAGSGGGGTAGDSAMMNGAGMPGGAGRAAAAGSGGRAAGGKSGGAGAPAGGAGTSGGAGTASAGMGGMAVGLADCPMPPAETPATAITALNTENTLRVAMGLDCAIIALPLCKSAQSHCDYYTQNQGTTCEADSPHDEIADCPGFTGEGLGERFKAAGYTLSGSGSEDMCFLDDPEKAVMTFVNSVYHRTSILDPWMRDFGYGNSDGCDTIDFGTGMKSDKALTAVYPYPDQTGIPTSFDGSREGPTPPMPSSGWPSGFPVTVYAQNFTVTSHVITVDGSTDELAHQYLDETDPTLPKYAKFLYTDAPMTANTKYHVVVSGTIGGTAKTFDWSFTTGAATGGGRPRP